MVALGLAILPATFRSSLWIVCEVAGAATLAALLLVAKVLRALLAWISFSAALLAALHVVVLVALLTGAFMLLAASTLIRHCFSPY
ncbi:MAG: hypothetical protein M3Y43_12155 [Pseudomonadota bacterium]|nr:hypothetical protein [Pseudomonadota bacterium]MDQ2705911.1 hypothetical protein [Pseudomonadota bacterium]